MPILRPDIQSALRLAGISKSTDDEPGDIQSKLDKNNLSVNDAIGHLGDLINGADSSSVKLRAVQDVFKMHGILKDSVPAPPAVNIIIHDSNSTKGLNPILIPRLDSVLVLEAKE